MDVDAKSLGGDVDDVADAGSERVSEQVHYRDSMDVGRGDRAGSEEKQAGSAH